MLFCLYDVMTQLVERQGYKNCIKNGLMLVDVDPFVNHKMLYVFWFLMPCHHKTVHQEP